MTLLVRTQALCVDTITKSVLVYDKPAIFFTPNNGCKGVEILFKDFSTCTYGTPASWQWKFGDGGTANTQNPSYTYSSEGTYEVTLITSTSHNCTDSAKRIINIKLGPEVDFEYGKACDGEEVQFTNKTFTYPWAQIIERLWDFGDTNTSTLINPTHIYTNGAGIYDVTLTVKSINGCIVPLTKQIKVNAIPNANYISGNACAKVPFQFFDISSVDNDSIVHWLWNFGNQGSDTIKNPLFTFMNPGAYTVNLEVTSSAGCSNYIFYDMEVYPSPTASFTLTPRFGIAPLTVQFNNTSTGANAALWYFGDNSMPSTYLNPVHTYMQNGIYTVQLIATNSLGCQNSAYDMVNVIPTILDIAVKDVDVNIKDNYVVVTVLLENLGTRPVDRLDLKATSSNGMIFREQWQGDIQPGDTVSYTFNAQFMLSDQPLDYVCVEAITKEIENDIDMANNQFCEAVTEEFTAINTFPNPAINEVQINIIIPAENDVTLEIFDAQGNRIATLYDGVLPKGLSQFKVNIEGLRKGMYSYVVRYNDKTLMKKFIKM